MNWRRFEYWAGALVGAVVFAALLVLGIRPPGAVFFGLMAALFYEIIWSSAKIDGLTKALYGAGVIAAIMVIEWYFGVLH